MTISGIVFPTKVRNDNVIQWNLNKKQLHLQKKTVTILPQERLELLSKEYGNGIKQECYCRSSC